MKLSPEEETRIEREFKENFLRVYRSFTSSDIPYMYRNLCEEAPEMAPEFRKALRKDAVDIIYSCMAAPYKVRGTIYAAITPIAAVGSYGVLSSLSEPQIVEGARPALALLGITLTLGACTFAYAGLDCLRRVQKVKTYFNKKIYPLI